LAKSPRKAYINTTAKKDLLTQLKMHAVWEGKRLNEILEEAIQDLLDRCIREDERFIEKKEKGELSPAELELRKHQQKLMSQRVEAELKKKSGRPSKKTKTPKK
jgi:hypothetical protein